MLLINRKARVHLPYDLPQDNLCQILFLEAVNDVDTFIPTVCPCLFVYSQVRKIRSKLQQVVWTSKFFSKINPLTRVQSVQNQGRPHECDL